MPTLKTGSKRRRFPDEPKGYTDMTIRSKSFLRLPPFFLSPGCSSSLSRRARCRPQPPRRSRRLKSRFPAWLRLGPFACPLLAFADDPALLGFGPAELLEFEEPRSAASGPPRDGIALVGRRRPRGRRSPAAKPASPRDRGPRTEDRLPGGLRRSVPFPKGPSHGEDGTASSGLFRRAAGRFPSQGRRRRPDDGRSGSSRRAST